MSCDNWIQKNNFEYCPKEGETGLIRINVGTVDMVLVAQELGITKEQLDSHMLGPFSMATDIYEGKVEFNSPYNLNNPVENRGTAVNPFTGEAVFTDSTSWMENEYIPPVRPTEKITSYQVESAEYIILDEVTPNVRNVGNAGIYRPLSNTRTDTSLVDWYLKHNYGEGATRDQYTVDVINQLVEIGLNDEIFLNYFAEEGWSLHEIKEQLLLVVQNGQVSIEEISVFAIDVASRVDRQATYNSYANQGSFEYYDNRLNIQTYHVTVLEIVTEQNGYAVVDDGSSRLRFYRLASPLNRDEMNSYQYDQLMLAEDAGSLQLLAGKYLDAENTDNMFQSIKDWDMAGEDALLQDLQTRIHLISPSILGLSTEPVVTAFQAYHDSMRQEWQQKKDRSSAVNLTDEAFKSEANMPAWLKLFQAIRLPLDLIGMVIEPIGTALDLFDAVVFRDPFAIAALSLPFVTGVWGRLKKWLGRSDGVRDSSKGLGSIVGGTPNPPSMPDPDDFDNIADEVTDIVTNTQSDDLVQKIQTAISSDDKSDRLEGTVAQFLLDNNVEVTGFNQLFTVGNLDGEFDILTSNAIIEVTDGRGNKGEQIRKFVEVRDILGLQVVIIYAPKYGRFAVNSAVANGAKVVRTLDELLEELRKLGEIE